MLSLSRSTLLTKGTALAFAAAVALSVVPQSADARVGGGFSFGSRGTRTFSAPPATMTAPRPAFPMQSTETPRLGTQAPGWASPGPRRFGFGSGLAAGLLGAGLIGMLTGHGFFGGIGGLFSMFGFLLQIGLIVVLVRLAFGWFRNRSGATAYAGPAGPMPRSGLGGLGMGLGRGGAGPQPQASVPIEQGDFATFERILSEIQYAHSREDLGALARLTTPEMLRRMEADIQANQRQGVRNELTDVRLLQGDLAESWREGPTDYATVAMRFAARDVMVDRAAGRVVAGDPNVPVEATEVWTFRRDAGGPWRLSAIQQTG